MSDPRIGPRVMAAAMLRRRELEEARKLGIDIVPTVSKAVLLSRLSEIAQSSVFDYIDETGQVTWASIKASGKAHLIKAVNQTPDGLGIEMFDVLKAMELLCRYRGGL
jgi:hypothetical protein